jgi:ABC-type Zn2+ transport system substrate-binding protein/surface adhesin
MRFYFLLIISLVFLSCKHKQDEADPKLKEALQIQDEGIHMSMWADSVLNARMTQGNVDQNIEQLRSWKLKLESIKNSMIMIPGLEHDHDHGDHAGHDHAHHDHSHDHAKEDIASSLKPDEMLKVQKEWTAAIQAIRDSLK